MSVIDKRRIVLAAAAGTAALAGILSWLFLRHLEVSYQQAGEHAAVLVAKRYIPRGTPLRPDFFQKLEIPKSHAEPGAVSSFEILESSPGRPRFRSTLPLPQKTQLVFRELQDLDQPEALSQHIPDHQVAVSFSVDATRGLGGNLQPGDRIDILGAKPVRRLFEAVPVIAVGKTWAITSDAEPPKLDPFLQAPPGQEDEIVLSVLLNPLAAVRLAEARDTETLSVVLRARGNDRPWGDLP